MPESRGLVECGEVKSPTFFGLPALTFGNVWLCEIKKHVLEVGWIEAFINGGWQNALSFMSLLEGFQLHWESGTLQDLSKLKRNKEYHFQAFLSWWINVLWHLNAGILIGEKGIVDKAGTWISLLVSFPFFLQEKIISLI